MRWRDIQVFGERDEEGMNEIERHSLLWKEREREKDEEGMSEIEKCPDIWEEK